MASTPEEMARRFEQQAQTQREQLDMIRAQQESIDSLKQMLSQLIEDKKKKPKAKGLPGSPELNRRKRKARLLNTLRRLSIATLSHPNLNPKRKAIRKYEHSFQKNE